MNFLCLVSQPTRLASWLMLMLILFFVFEKKVKSQEKIYEAPDVNIFDSPEQVFELPGSGDYIPAEEIRRYNFNNINHILRNTTGVYSREETGLGIIPNISIRGTATLDLHSLLEDSNIAPYHISPDAIMHQLQEKCMPLKFSKGQSI